MNDNDVHGTWIKDNHKKLQNIINIYLFHVDLFHPHVQNAAVAAVLQYTIAAIMV